MESAFEKIMRPFSFNELAGAPVCHVALDHPLRREAHRLARRHSSLHAIVEQLDDGSSPDFVSSAAPDGPWANANAGMAVGAIPCILGLRPAILGV